MIILKISVHHLINEPFLNDRDQLRREEVKESQTIGLARIYSASNTTCYLAIKNDSSTCYLAIKNVSSA